MYAHSIDRTVTRDDEDVEITVTGFFYGGELEDVDYDAPEGVVLTEDELYYVTCDLLDSYGGN